MKRYNETRLLSDMGNLFWQSKIAPVMAVYLFSNICITLSASVIAAPVMPLELYVLFPTSTVITTTVLIYSFPLLASIRKKSELSLGEVKRILPRLRHADPMAFKYAQRRVNAQRPFGYKLGSNSFISLDTVQLILSESSSYSLLIVSLAREVRGS